MSAATSSSAEKSEYLALVKSELVSTWAYLSTYVELFDHPDPRRMDLLLESAPGFFALVQSALLEAVFVRMARLMDPKASNNGKYPNLSFDGLLAGRTLRAAELFATVKDDWRSGQYQMLETYRNKVHAHNDLTTVRGSTTQVNAKLTQEDVTKLRELFVRLWAVLAAAYLEINNTAILEPSFGSSDMIPSQILRQLKLAAYQNHVLDAEPLEGSDRQGLDSPA